MGGAVFETSSLEALRSFNEMQRCACVVAAPRCVSVLTQTCFLACPLNSLEKQTDTLSSGIGVNANQAKFRR